MQNRLFLVRAGWDEDAGVWVATSEDVPGLVTEAETLEQIRAKVLIMLPELLAANAVPLIGNEILVHILAEQTARIVNSPPVFGATP